MNDTSRCREKTEGWKGRRRNYRCRECGVKFQANTLSALPEIDRVCPNCRIMTQVYTFEDKQTGKKWQTRTGDIELATLRAWKINPNYTLKLSQKTMGEVETRLDKRKLLMGGTTA